MAQELCNICYVTNEADLPEVWTQLANCARGVAIATVTSCVSSRFQAANMGWAPDSIPIVTTQLNDQVFKSLIMGRTGQQMGEGLTPFAVVCANHAEGQAVIKASAAADSGNRFDLQDVHAIMVSDFRLPVTPYTAAEKLVGWSILIDVVLGAIHPCAMATHNFALMAAPLLLRFSNNMIPIATAMEHALAVLFHAQQEFFLWLARPRRSLQPLPDLLSLTALASSRNFPWEPFALGSPRDHPKDSKPAAMATKEKGSGGNLKPDLAMQKRYKDSGSPALGAMMGDLAEKVPTNGGKEMCLSWTLQGKCRPGCPRKVNHKPLGVDAMKRLHDFLDLCPGITAPRS